jgi:hypothetical protein
VRLFRPIWVALRAAVIATAVFWVTIFVIENSGWEAPAIVVQLGVFFVIFFLGMLVVRRR